MMENSAVLRTEGIGKRFGSTVALDGVSMDLRKGEIHAVLGENGAGKTTLMNLLFGLLAPDRGRMTLWGEPYAPRSPKQAAKAGLGMVHQHFMLVPTLSVLENILLGEKPFSFFSRKSEGRLIQDRMRELGFELPLHERTGNLSMGRLQRVEIFKLLYRGARILILDEPTAVLAPQERRDLFRLLEGLRQSGRSVLFISHKLDEIESLCDRATVLRKGRTVGSFRVSETDRGELSRLMLGRDVEYSRNKGGSTPPRKDDFRLVFQGTGKTLRGDWSCGVSRGAITAIAGVDGNGQTELAEGVVGLASVPGLRALRGEANLPTGVKRRLEEGVGLIAEDRQRTGLVLDFSIKENLAIKDVSRPPWSYYGWIRERSLNEIANNLVRRFDVQPPDANRPARELSGGNQQKVVVAREISRPHEFLVAFNPTRGLDVGARESVHRALLEDRDSGAAILLISTELEEVLALADRIYVICRGEISEVSHENWSEEEIGLAMMGAGRDQAGG